MLKSADTVRCTIRCYEAKGLDGLRDQRHAHPGVTPKVTLAWKAELLHAVEYDSHSLGLDRVSWMAPLLVDYVGQKIGVRSGEERVRRYLDSIPRNICGVRKDYAAWAA